MRLPIRPSTKSPQRPQFEEARSWTGGAVLSALCLICREEQIKARFPVHTKIMKWTAIATLFLSVLGFPLMSHGAVLEVVVCVSGLLVVTQAIRAGKYFWAAGFLAIAVLFNPVVPLPLSGTAFLSLEWVCLAAFFASLAVLRIQPTLSVLSITSRAPRSEAL